MNDLKSRLISVAAVPVSEVSLAGEPIQIQVNMDTRLATANNTFFGLQHDHMAKNLVFVVTRHVNGVDLSTKSCAVHWANGKNAGVHAVDGIDLSVDGKILILLSVRNTLTRYGGAVALALHFYSIEDGSFTYHIASQPAVGRIGRTINSAEHSEQCISPSEVERLIQMLDYKVSMTGWAPNKYMGTDEDGNVVVRDGPTGGGLPADNPLSTVQSLANDLNVDENGQLSVKTANAVEQDNDLPISSAAVYAVVGNIQAMLEEI